MQLLCGGCETPTVAGSDTCSQCSGYVRDREIVLLCPQGHSVSRGWKFCTHCPDELGDKRDLRKNPPTKTQIAEIRRQRQGRADRDRRGQRMASAGLLGDPPPDPGKALGGIGNVNLGEAVVNRSTVNVQGSPGAEASPQRIGDINLGDAILSNSTVSVQNITQHVSDQAEITLDRLPSAGVLPAFRATIEGRHYVLKQLPEGFDAVPELQGLLDTQASQRGGSQAGGTIARFRGIQTVRGVNYLARDYCLGTSIADTVASKVLEDRETLRMLKGVARLLTSQGEVVHGDLGPTNVFQNGNEVSVCDIGAREILEFVASRTRGSLFSPGDTWLHRSGAQLLGDIPPTPRIFDVMSLGLLGLFAMSGHSDLNVPDPFVRYKQTYGAEPARELAFFCVNAYQGRIDRMVAFRNGLERVRVGTPAAAGRRRRRVTHVF